MHPCILKIIFVATNIDKSIFSKYIYCAHKNEVNDMRGRPKQEITREIVYKVRLNAEEDHMLTCASEWTGQAKSEVFRKALQGYYKAVEAQKCKEDKSLEEAGWPIDHISLDRLIKCPRQDCGEEFVVDFTDYSEDNESEGPMGCRCEHTFDTDEIECPECHRRIRVRGTISEYPIGAYEYEDITISEG